MSKKSLLPVLSLSVLALAAPQALWAQEEAEQVSANASMTLDTVVVTATRTEESLREVTANTTVITAERINNSTAQTLADVLVQQGFQVIDNGASKQLKIRGMGQNSMGSELESNVLVLLNGVRLGANNVALMGLDNIERVEIIRGPSAVQYGSSAMGGVVNIITKRGVPGETELAVEAGLGSFDLHKEILSLSGGAGGFDFSGSVTNWGRDEYDVSGGKEWAHTALDSSTNLNLDMGYTFLEKHRIGVNFNYYNQNDSEFPGGGWREVTRGNPLRPNDYNIFDYENYNLAFLYEGATDDDRFSWFTRYSFGKDMEQAVYKTDYPDDWAETTIDNKSASGQLAYNGDMFTLAVGLDYLKYDLDRSSSFDLPLNSSQENIGGYLSAKLRLLDEMLILSAGGRYDHFKNEVSGYGSKNDNNFAPSLGLAVLPNDWLKFRANYSEGFKMASPRQIIGFDNSFGTYLPNPGLSAEKSKTFEIGADVAWEFLEANLTYFHSKWDDKIVGVTVKTDYFPSYFVTSQYQNIPSATIAGLELALGANLGQAFNWEVDLRPYINMTYLTTRKNKDRRGIDYKTSVQYVGSSTLTDTPKYTISYGVDFAYPDYDFKANINAVYSGETLTRDYRMGYYDPIYNNSNYVKHSGGTVVDLSLEKGLITFDNCSKLKLKVDVKNLFDADNDSHLDYPGPGRNFYVGLRYEFK